MGSSNQICWITVREKSTVFNEGLEHLLIFFLILKGDFINEKNQGVLQRTQKGTYLYWSMRSGHRRYFDT